MWWWYKLINNHSHFFTFFVILTICRHIKCHYNNYYENINVDKYILKKKFTLFTFFVIHWKKMSEKNYDIFYRIYFKNVTIMLSRVKKNKNSISFLKNPKTDIFKNVKNRKKFFRTCKKYFFYKLFLFFINYFYFLFYKLFFIL